MELYRPAWFKGCFKQLFHDSSSHFCNWTNKLAAFRMNNFPLLLCPRPELNCPLHTFSEIRMRLYSSAVLISLHHPLSLSIVLWWWYNDNDRFLKTKEASVVAYYRVLHLHLPIGTGDSRSRGSNPGPTEYEAYVNNQYAATYSHNLFLIIKIQNWSRFTHSRVSKDWCSLFQFS
jgi:hypothetical protein